MIPKSIWQIPKYGTINLHASLLPNYRGSAPINWAIINNENFTGVTTFFIDDKIDTGDILLQEKIKLDKKINAGELHDKLKVIGANTVKKTIKEILNNSLIKMKQKYNVNYKTAYRLDKENIKIVDLSRLAAGNMVSHMFADFGADVVKIEKPGKGDDLRNWKINGISHWWAVYSRNKRSISIDLKKD